MKRSPLNKRGKKTREWEKIRRDLKRRFERVGITRCEVKYAQCWNDYALSFAHGKKRLNLTAHELETLVVLSCAPCHTAIEGLPEFQMLGIVESIIAARPVQP